jgi:hypothetical protein
MPEWSKTKEIKFSENERIAIARKEIFDYKNWDEVPPYHTGQKTINALRDFEKEEGIRLRYDKKDCQIYIQHLPDYRDKLALK